MIKDFIKMCQMSQTELKAELATSLKDYYKKVFIGDGFIYAKGNIPYCLTAHLDTVHKDRIKKYSVKKKKGDTIISSPQGIGGDDRCGVYIIMEILQKTNLRPTIVFCEDEERGGIGSGKFCKTELIKDLSEMNFLIELDRANANDAVYYNCDNPEFEKYIYEQTKYETSWGSFSDISTLAPECGVAAVNFSCGYYKAHTVEEYVIFEEMENTKAMVIDLISKQSKQYEYIEMIYPVSSWSTYYTTTKAKTANYLYDAEIDMEIIWKNKKGKEEISFVYGYTEEECWCSFFMENPDVCFNDVLDWNQVQ